MTASLVERVESAEVGSGLLDHEIFGLFYDSKTVPGLEAGAFSFEREEGWYCSIPAFTTSLDAALALAEQVLPGGLKSYQIAGLLGRHAAAIGDSDPTSAATPALALVAAILRAHEASK